MTAGIQAVVDQVSAYVAKCPDSAVVLVGYAQGSQIIDDAFCGGPDGNSMSETAAPIPADVSEHVKALIFMSNPRNVPGLPYNVGTAKAGGVSFPSLPFIPAFSLVSISMALGDIANVGDASSLLNVTRALFVPSTRTGFSHTATPRTPIAATATTRCIASNTSRSTENMP